MASEEWVDGIKPTEMASDNIGRTYTHENPMLNV